MGKQDNRFDVAASVGIQATPQTIEIHVSKGFNSLELTSVTHVLATANTLLGPNKKAKVGNVGTPSTGTKPKVRSGTTAAPLKGMGIMSFFLKSKGTHSANHPIA